MSWEGKDKGFSVSASSSEFLPKAKGVQTATVMSLKLRMSKQQGRDKQACFGICKRI